MRARHVVVLVISLVLAVVRVAAADTPDPKRIEINVAARTLTLWENGTAIATYPVAVGLPKSPTPIGRFHVSVKLRDPVWYGLTRRGGDPVPPGPDNPLGPVWIGLNKPRYGIHGTIVPSSIGTFASLGCVRLDNDDAEAVFGWVDTDVPVDIIYERVTVKTDSETGVRTVMVHPDVYRLGSPEDGQIVAVLTGVGMSEEFSMASLPVIREALNASSRGLDSIAVHAASPVRVFVGEDELAAEAFIQDGRAFLPLRAVGEALGRSVHWDETLGQAILDGVPVTGVRRGDRIFISVRQAAELLGRSVEWDERTRSVHISN